MECHKGFERCPCVCFCFWSQGVLRIFSPDANKNIMKNICTRTCLMSCQKILMLRMTSDLIAYDDPKSKAVGSGTDNDGSEMSCVSLFFLYIHGRKRPKSQIKTIMLRPHRSLHTWVSCSRWTLYFSWSWWFRGKIGLYVIHLFVDYAVSWLHEVKQVIHDSNWVESEGWECYFWVFLKILACFTMFGILAWYP